MYNLECRSTEQLDRARPRCTHADSHKHKEMLQSNDPVPHYIEPHTPPRVIQAQPLRQRRKNPFSSGQSFTNVLKKYFEVVKELVFRAWHCLTNCPVYDHL